MKNYKILSILGVMIWAAAFFIQPAFAARTLEIGSAQVNNTGAEDTRTATLDVTLKGGAKDVNGLVFTLVYNSEIFTFEGLVEGDMPIESTYDPENPPTPETIGSTLYYQANNKASQGIVLFSRPEWAMPFTPLPSKKPLSVRIRRSLPVILRPPNWLWPPAWLLMRIR